MSLKFALAGSQIRHFKHGLQCLAKIGSELLLEGIAERLVLRSINSAKSAFMAVTFNSPFFDTYDVFNTHVVQAGILMKNVLAVFRTQRVSSMVFELSQEGSRLTVTLSCDNGLTKRYSLDCMDAEILQATVDRSAFPTCVVAEASELNRLLGSFQTSLDEITIIALPESNDAANEDGPANGTGSFGAGAGTQQRQRAVQIQSFFDPAKAASDKALRTQLEVDTRSLFLSYSHASEGPADVTFNVKDLRCLLSLCEHMGANISLLFDSAGMPLLAEPHFRGAHEVDYSAELVLATLMESQAPQAETDNQQQQQQQQGQQQQQQQARSGGVTPAPGRRNIGPAGTTPNVPGDTPWNRTEGGRTNAPAARAALPGTRPAPPPFALPATTAPLQQPEGSEGGAPAPSSILRFNQNPARTGERQQQQQQRGLSEQQQEGRQGQQQQTGPQQQQQQRQGQQQQQVQPQAPARRSGRGSGGSSGLSRLQRLEAEIELEFESERLRKSGGGSGPGSGSAAAAGGASGSGAGGSGSGAVDAGASPSFGMPMQQQPQQQSGAWHQRSAAPTPSAPRQGGAVSALSGPSHSDSGAGYYLQGQGQHAAAGDGVASLDPEALPSGTARRVGVGVGGSGGGDGGGGDGAAAGPYSAGGWQHGQQQQQRQGQQGPHGDVDMDEPEALPQRRGQQQQGWQHQQLQPQQQQGWQQYPQHQQQQQQQQQQDILAEFADGGYEEDEDDDEELPATPPQEGMDGEEGGAAVGFGIIATMPTQRRRAGGHGNA